MVKYYKVVKDHPMWEIGAILSNEYESSKYKPLDALFVKEVRGLDETWYEGAVLVENQPEWFERVYKVSLLKRVRFLAKDEARKAHDRLYSTK